MILVIDDFRWETIMPMWQGRFGLAAVHIPCEGILAIGGNRDHRWLNAVEFLPLMGDDEDLAPWRLMSPMLQGVRAPTACFFEGSVYVCTVMFAAIDLESFNIKAGACGQWTSVRCQLYNPYFYHYLLNLNGKLHIIGD